MKTYHPIRPNTVTCSMDPGKAILAYGLFWAGLYHICGHQQLQRAGQVVP